MSTLSPVNTLPLITIKPVPTVLPGTGNSGTTATTAAPTSIVTLGKNAALTSAQTYSSRGLVDEPATRPVLENERQDKVTLTMEGNFAAQPPGGVFHGLGAALLTQLSEGVNNYSQSLLKSSTGQALDPTEQLVDQTQLHTAADNSITLTVKTASGSTVLINLASQANGLAVQVQVKGGTLSDAERSAVGNLADAFQSAIDGFTETPPRLDLSKLTQFDPSLLSSVDLNAQLKLGESKYQTLGFHADGQNKTVNMSGPIGSLQLAVNTKNSQIMGNAQQQSQALNSYLSQFDAARRRGDGNQDLMTLFKDAFSAMNSVNSKDLKQVNLKTPSSISLNDVDHGMLTGLADFTASITQVPQSINPMRVNETDNFSYQVLQTTSINGENQLNHSIKQDQQSHLTASYHQGLYPGALAALDHTKQSQNYKYLQINDDASSSTSVAYKAGLLTAVSLVQAATQTTHSLKYEMGDLKEDTTTPVEATKTQDLLGILQTALRKDKQETKDSGSPTSENTLAIHSQVILQADPW
ncbi:MAG: L-lactate dehydrogenase [Pseudomonas sp.]|uniref:lactate dehydrogenase n=1 Tax=Pseudomonas sp. TaxID=306 RepID=UPI00262D6AC3|nr:lactate dehydrogenase [Pseudomonas sp.]MDB6052039.1 L-lactate dehydrogenase [Pseudomonas sp.]